MIKYKKGWKCFLKITMTVIKDTGDKDDAYIVKIGTSKGSGQVRHKGLTADEIGQKIAETIREADAEGFVGKS